MGLNTRSIGNALRLQHELNDKREEIIEHVHRVMLSSAILYSPAAKAIMSDTQEMFDASFGGISATECEPIYYWMVALGAMIMERPDHALSLVHVDEISGNIMRTFQHIEEKVAKRDTNDYKYSLEHRDGHWCLMANAEATHLGKVFPTTVEIGFLHFSRQHVTNLEIEMYERVARVFIAQHWDARKSEDVRNGLDYSYEHKD
jgi:hypothetical protein